MFGYLAKSLQDLKNPKISKIIGKAVLLSVLVLFGLTVALWFALRLLPWDAGDWQWLLEIGGILAAVLLSWILFPIFMTAAIGLYQEEIVRAVEHRSYPEAPPLRHIGIAEGLWQSIGFVLVGVIANLIALPLFLAVLILSPFYPIVFYGLNGYLLGREYFLTIASLHLSQKQAMRLWDNNRRRIIIAGFFFAFLLTLPVVNLVAPVIATSFMVHFFSDLYRKEKISSHHRLEG